MPPVWINRASYYCGEFMQSVNLKFNNVSFSYDTSSENIVSSLTIHLSAGWTGIVGANGTGKTTIAKLATGHLVPTNGHVTASCESPLSVYCSQETETMPEKSVMFITDTDNHAGRIRSILEIDDDWPGRWNTLSHGERKRFQTGLALWLNPDILALDEPTNHLDLGSKKYIADALRTYEGVGLIISHDRELLDDICSSCLFVSRDECIMRPGGVTAGLLQEEIENKNRERTYSESLEQYRRLKRSARELREKEESRSGSLSKKKLDRHDHDGKGKIDLARLTGKDKIAGRKITLMEKKRDAAKKAADDNHYRRRKIEGFTFTGEPHKRRVLLNLPEGRIALSPGRYIAHPLLAVYNNDRIGITGENGSGKSTLIRHLIPSFHLPPGELVYMQQEISTAELAMLKKELAGLAGNDKGRLLSIIHRLGSEPERIIESPLPSPGEARKIMLGLGLLKSPSLILMDEPTNHMDLPSVLCLEKALRQFTGAMIIISHDMRFIGNVSTQRWHIEKTGTYAHLVKR